MTEVTLAGISAAFGAFCKGEKDSLSNIFSLQKRRCPVEVFDDAANKDLESLFKTVSTCLKSSFDARDNSLPLVSNAASTLVFAYLQDQNRPNLRNVRPCVKLLHDTILLDDDTQNGAAKVCEKWWADCRPGREEIIPNTLLFLLAQCVDGSRASDAKRLLAVRDAFTLLDLNGEDCVAVVRMLLRLVSCPAYVRMDAGQKLLSFVMSSVPELLGRIHGAVRDVLPKATTTVASTYGEIYFRAWRSAADEGRNDIEQTCIQPFMRAAVLCGDSGLAANLRHLLHSFHTHKRDAGVDDMLLKLYEPILFRAIGGANQFVRYNAASLLIDAFPLLPSDANASETQDHLQQQCGELQLLLDDSSVDVRCLGVKGCCQVLNLYWELIPRETSHHWLKRLIGDMAHDASSADVRTAVLRGLIELLSNCFTHSTLKVLLTVGLKPLINDQNERVRCAILDLLLCVKKVDGIRYFDIVPVEDLLSRLCIEGGSGSRRLCKLLCNSFVPLHRPRASHLARLLKLTSDYPVATRIFFSHAVDFVPIGALVSLTGLLHRALRIALGLSDIEVTHLGGTNGKAQPTNSRKRGGKSSRKRTRDAAKNDDVEGDVEGATDWWDIGLELFKDDYSEETLQAIQTVAEQLHNSLTACSEELTAREEIMKSRKASADKLNQTSYSAGLFSDMLGVVANMGMTMRERLDEEECKPLKAYLQANINSIRIMEMLERTPSESGRLGVYRLAMSTVPASEAAGRLTVGAMHALKSLADPQNQETDVLVNLLFGWYAEEGVLEQAAEWICAPLPLLKSQCATEETEVKSARAKKTRAAKTKKNTPKVASTTCDAEELATLVRLARVGVKILHLAISNDRVAQSLYHKEYLLQQITDALCMYVPLVETRLAQESASGPPTFSNSADVSAAAEALCVDALGTFATVEIHRTVVQSGGTSSVSANSEAGGGEQDSEKRTAPVTLRAPDTLLKMIEWAKATLVMSAKRGCGDFTQRVLHCVLAIMGDCALVSCGGEEFAAAVSEFAFALLREAPAVSSMCIPHLCKVVYQWYDSAQHTAAADALLCAVLVFARPDAHRAVSRALQSLLSLHNSIGQSSRFVRILAEDALAAAVREAESGAEPEDLTPEETSRYEATALHPRLPASLVAQTLAKKSMPVAQMALEVWASRVTDSTEEWRVVRAAFLVYNTLCHYTGILSISHSVAAAVRDRLDGDSDCDPSLADILRRVEENPKPCTVTPSFSAKTNRSFRHSVSKRSPMATTPLPQPSL